MSSTAPSCTRSSGAAAKAGRNRSSISRRVSRPPPPCASSMRSRVRRRDRADRARSCRRPAIAVIGGAGAFGGDHGGAQRRARACSACRRRGSRAACAAPRRIVAADAFAGWLVRQRDAGPKRAARRSGRRRAPRPSPLAAISPMPRQRRGATAKTSAHHRLRGDVALGAGPSGCTGSPPRRGPASSCATQSSTPCRMSSGSKPVTTIGTRIARARSARIPS